MTDVKEVEPPQNRSDKCSSCGDVLKGVETSSECVRCGALMHNTCTQLNGKRCRLCLIEKGLEPLELSGDDPFAAWGKFLLCMMLLSGFVILFTGSSTTYGVKFVATQALMLSSFLWGVVWLIRFVRRPVE